MPSGAKSFVAVGGAPAGKQAWTMIGPIDRPGIAEAPREGAPSSSEFRPACRRSSQGGNLRYRHRDLAAARCRCQPVGLRTGDSPPLDTHVCPRWRDRDLVAIGRAELTALLDQIEDRHGQRQADRCSTIIRAVTNWHTVRMDGYHPPVVRGMRRQSPAAQARARVLDDVEIAPSGTPARARRLALSRACAS